MTRKKLLAFFLAVLLTGCLVTPAYAEETQADAATTAENQTETPVVDWGIYAYEELILLRDNLIEYIKEMERQYAIENGNRSITLNETSSTIYKGKNITLEAEVKRTVEDAPEKTDLVWTSSDEAIAKVSSTGVVTAVGEGEAVITCSAADDEYIFSVATVNVVLPVEKITVTEPKITLMLSEQDPSAADNTLTYTIAPLNAYIQDVSWSSSNEEIATVDENGKVHAVSPGTVKIVATSKEETTAPKSSSCTVTVLQAVSSIELDIAKTTLNVRDSKNLVATVYPENASMKTVTWESSDPSVATVSTSGKITAVATGTATITCTAADGSGVTSSCEVTVIQMVTGLKIEAESNNITINKNESTILNVLVAPENATTKGLMWETSDATVALIGSDGKLTAVGGGAATITCTAIDGSGKTAKINVYVPSIAVESTEYSVASKSGLEITFKYYGKAENLAFSPAKCANFTADMDQNGQTVTLAVCPEKAGKNTITITDKSDSRSTVKLTIIVEHSACYDSTSYPVGNYTNIMRAPSQYNGEPMSAYGRVLQISKGLFGTTLRVATRGRWDDVFYITCPHSMVEGIIEEDYITVYGECKGTETYTTIMGGSVTIPAMKAEKIFFGRH